MPRWDRVATYGVPLLAGVVTAAVLLGPGGERPVVGVRVRGLIAEGATTTSLQLHTVLHVDGTYRDAAVKAVHVVLFDGEEALGQWRGDTDASGRAEAPLSLARIAQRPTLFVRSGERVLAHGPIAIAPPLPRVRAAPLSQDSGMTIVMPRGFAVPELPEVIEISIRAPPDAPPAPRLSARGGDVSAPGEPEVRCPGELCWYTYRPTITVRAPTLELAVNAWEGLPIVKPGGMWLDPKGDRVVSPVPRERAYLSLMTTRGREWGTALTLQEKAGYFEASVALPAVVGPASLLIASDVGGDGAVAWPLLEGTAGEGVGGEGVGGKPAQLRDGLPRAIKSEKDRAFRAKLPAFGLVIAAALFELLFVLRKWRRTDKRLTTLAAAIDGTDAERLRVRTPLWWMTVLIFGLVVAFGILATMTLI